MYIAEKYGTENLLDLRVLLVQNYIQTKIKVLPTALDKFVSPDYNYCTPRVFQLSRQTRKKVYSE